MNQKLINSNIAAPELQADTGYTKCYYFELSVTSPDITNTGKVTGKIETYDYKSLYKVYNLGDDATPSQWTYMFNTDPDLKKIKIINESAVKLDMTVDLSYEVKGTGSPASIYIYYTTINLVTVNGEKKTYIVTNPSSAYATDQQGHPYSQFKVIT